MWKAGFTQVELLVALSVIALLMSVGLPAIGRSREAAKRVQCQNNLRNVALAIIHSEQSERRLPASGNFYDADGVGALHHSWAVTVLPWLDQGPLYDQWDLNRPITDAVNAPLTRAVIPTYVCPVDLSRSRNGGGGDSSYAVNGGVGFTVRRSATVGDCPVDRYGTALDLNGNGITCPDDPADDGAQSDRLFFKRMGLFFMENWNPGGTVRHHSFSDVLDGLSQTILVAENVRVGYDPEDVTASFASSSPFLCAFYIGNPCPTGTCADGTVDYSRSNGGDDRINAGVTQPEGRSPTPASFHSGGVHVAFADGRVTFQSETIDGRVYAALVSPQGRLLEESPLRQVLVDAGM